MNPVIKRCLLLSPLFFFLSSCGTHYKKADTGYGPREGVASWYGRDFHGRPTASGEVYNMHSLTAAHKELPFGTELIVTNLDNGKKTRVTVNDRGPFVRGRIIDLSYSAAKELDMVNSGTARVRLDITGRDMKYVKEVRFEEVGGGNYTVQLGAFVDINNARRLGEVLSWKYPRVYIIRAEVSGRMFHRVRIGSFKEREDALRLAKPLAEEGYEVVLMRE